MTSLDATVHTTARPPRGTGDAPSATSAALRVLQITPAAGFVGAGTPAWQGAPDVTAQLAVTIAAGADCVPPFTLGAATGALLPTGAPVLLDRSVQNAHPYSMARPKQFDRDDALRAGMRVFWQQGFAATTTDDLAKAMGVGRQSFYDTFGDKRRCYLEALRNYSRDDVAAQIEMIRRASSPLQALRDLMSTATWTDERRAMGCMAINSLAEFGASDAEIAATVAPTALLVEQTIVQLLREAKAKGEVAPSLDEQRAAGALICTRMGMMLGARGGRSCESLRAVADFTIDQLAAPDNRKA